MSLTPEEINRKLLHGLAVALPAGIFYGSHPEYLRLPGWQVTGIIGGILIASLAVEAVRFRNQAVGKLFQKCFGSMLRSRETNTLTGATYVFAGSFLCSLVALNDQHAKAAAFLALTLFILGDAVAALVGKAVGRTRIGGKTLEGTIGCFVLCFILAAFLFPGLPSFTKSWNGEFSLLDALVLSALVSVLELFPIRFGKLELNDNLYVPVLVTFAAIALQA